MRSSSRSSRGRNMDPAPRASRERSPNKAMQAQYLDLKEKHVLVTGGADGIGAALCRAFAEQGSQVTFLDKDEEKAAAVVETCKKYGGQVNFYKIDLTDSDELVDTLSSIKRRLPPVDVLIPNAGYDPRYDGLNMSRRQWDDLFALNLTHYFIACRELIPSMIDNGGGSIVMTASHTAWLAKPDLIAYNATKAGVIGLVRSLAEAYGKNGIRVNAVAPGWIMTRR